MIGGDFLGGSLRRSPFVKITMHFGGQGLPESSSVAFVSQSALTLLSKYFTLL